MNKVLLTAGGILLALCCAGTTLIGAGQRTLAGAATDPTACQPAPASASPAPAAGGDNAAVDALTDEQITNATTIVTVGQNRRLPARAFVIAIATALQESRLRNLGHLGERNDHDSLGLFQQRPSTGWGTPAQIRNPAYASGRFYAKLVTIAGWQSLPLTVAAQKVQISAYPDAYAKHEPLATALVAYLTDGQPLAGTCTSGGDGLAPEGIRGLPAGFRLPADPRLATVVSFALAQLGKPYVFGAAGPDSYDCSGLTQSAWAAAGVRIPRVTLDQVHTGTAVATPADLQPGDLIFIPGSLGTPSNPRHVGMAIGAGGDGRPYLIAAPRTGDVVKIVPVSSWAAKIVAVRRPAVPPSA